eukprot:1920204-Pleurochrysis_carterae.AAC.1
MEAAVHLSYTDEATVEVRDDHETCTAAITQNCVATLGIADHSGKSIAQSVTDDQSGVFACFIDLLACALVRAGAAAGDPSHADFDEAPNYDPPDAFLPGGKSCSQR